MTNGPTALQAAFEGAVRVVIDQVVPEIVERLLPAIIAEARKAADGEQRDGTGPVYVPVKTAAAMMSAHPVTVRRLIADGKLGRYSVEGQLRVKVTDIHAYMARAGGPSSPTIDIHERAVAILASTTPRNDS